jgi:hypothetical protein
MGRSGVPLRRLSAGDVIQTSGTGMETLRKDVAGPAIGL